MKWPFWRRRFKYLAVSEYWLYVPVGKIPPQAALLNRLLKLNPFDPNLPPPCGQEYGLFFSDIRLHIALVLRAKNAHIFRPDLFESYIEATNEMLEILASSQAMIKLRYVSDTPLKDVRHLHFMNYLLEAMATLTRGQLAFDTVAERLFLVEDLRVALKSESDGSRFDLNVRDVWIPRENGGMGATCGLVKVGVPELETPLSSHDHEVIIRHVLNLAARELWDVRLLPEGMTIQAYGDEFNVSFEQKDRTRATTRIQRIHDKS